MEKQKVGVKKTLEYTEAVAYLEALTKSFKSGTIVIESGEDHIVMKPAAQVSIKVEAKTKKDKQKIGFEIAWTDTDNADLKISDEAPAPVPAERQSAEVPATRPESAVPATQEPATSESAIPAKTEPAPKATAKKTKLNKSTAKKTSTTKTTAAAAGGKK